MQFQHLMEIGCERKASLHKFLNSENHLDIIECNPRHLSEIQKEYGDVPNVKIHPYAMWHTAGRVSFNIAGASSYVDGVENPPCVVNDNFYPENSPDWKVEVEARTFDEFDDGTIDIMDLDIEGAEWYVIQKMISRPKVIIVEMEWKNYVNPFYKEISDWMSQNYYVEFNKEAAAIFYRRLI